MPRRSGAKYEKYCTRFHSMGKLFRKLPYRYSITLTRYRIIIFLQIEGNSYSRAKTSIESTRFSFEDTSVRKYCSAGYRSIRVLFITFSSSHSLRSLLLFNSMLAGTNKFATVDKRFFLIFGAMCNGYRNG